MRIAFGLLSQETNTFNPIASELADFSVFGHHRGRRVIEEAANSRPVAGFLDGLGSISDDVELVPLVKATAVAGGRLSASTLTALTGELLTELDAAGPVDGVGLLLHGACAADGEDDVEGHLLAQVRARVGDRVPVVVGLDHHANLTARMVAHASAIIGHRTQPHDTFDTARRTADLLVRIVRGEATPVMAWRKLPLLSHQEQFLTSQPPMQTWFARARAHEEAPRVLCASTFPMQPWLDVAEGGWAALVVADGDQALTQHVADDLAELAWALREAFQETTSLPPDEAVARAATTAGLSIVSDTGDAVRGGAGGDSTVLLAELLRAGTPRTLLTIVDPPAVSQAGAVRVGDRLEVSVGGALTGWFEPVVVAGTVTAVDDPVLYPDDGFPLGEVAAGPTVVLEADPVTLVITTLAGVAGNHPVQYTHFGIDPAEYGAVVLKTASNFQHFRHLSTDVIRADTPGPSQSDLHALPWRRIPRPIYPLDAIDDWRR